MIAKNIVSKEIDLQVKPMSCVVLSLDRRILTALPE
jgi:hypothetical protein